MGELPATRVYRGIRDEKPAPSGGVARADLCLADAAVDELLTRIAELDAEHRYPHMCRDGHPEIGHATDAERCPVCLERDAREMAEAALAEAEHGRTKERERYDALRSLVGDLKLLVEAELAEQQRFLDHCGCFDLDEVESLYDSWQPRVEQAEAELAERDGMLDLLIEDDFGYAPGSIKADGLKDGYRARAKEDLK